MYIYVAMSEMQPARLQNVAVQSPCCHDLLDSAAWKGRIVHHYGDRPHI